MYDTVSNSLTEALKREGKVIYDGMNNTPINVIFRRNSDKNNTTDRVSIFYPIQENIKQGQILNYKNNSYIALNQETAENDIYYKSDLLKINTTINMIAGSEEISIKCYAGNLQSVNLITSEVISVVGGTLSLIAEDNEQSRKLDINNTFIALGATWKIVNLIYKTGICYIYVERTQDSGTAVNYTLSIVANDEYNVEDTAILTATAMADTTVITNATITWKSSDDTIATITNDGQLTCLAEGTVTITATWQEHDITETKVLTISEAAPVVQNIATITYTGSPEIKSGGSAKTFTANFTDSEGTVLSLIPIWSLDLTEAQTGKVIITEQTGNIIKLKCEMDYDIMFTSFDLHLSDSEDTCSTTQKIDIISL